ncbi:MAG: DUF1934 family protein [Clostridia bacterium]|nr:DUF1934 family protein [Clostridia bacterium]
MERCKIEISTTTDGKTDVFQTDGRLKSKNNGYEVCYEQEGDFVTLRFDKTTFQMKRSGGANLSCTFYLGGRTAMLVSGYGGAGEIPVQTSVYSFRPFEKGCLIQLHYDVIFSDHFQMFQLELKIETSEEK